MGVLRFLAHCRRLFRFFSDESTAETGNAPPPNASPPVDAAAAQAGVAITDTERISRFILDERHLRPTQKFRAFEPPSNETVISVSRTDGLVDDEVWAHADTHVGQPSGRTVAGRGDFTRPDARDVEAGGFRLDVEPDEHPDPPRHASVVGYPAIEEKEIRRSLAQQLAAKVITLTR
jgi:hypothetical protein